MDTDILESLFRGEKRAAARLITLIEGRHPSAPELIGKIHARTGGAHIVGITGPPGTGKSTLVAGMTRQLRRMDKKVGILAIDPSSPFTGGALLGDRIRMSELSLDPGVFIRSMGARGNLGGLSWATNDAVKVLDAMGNDVVLVETVGAGQSEVDIVKTAHTCVVVAVPGLGDDIQAIKAGLMEIGDVFAVNKADLPGADRQKQEIETMLHLAEQEGWNPPVLLTNARDEQGLEELVKATRQHYDYLRETGRLGEKELERSRNELEEILDRKIDDLVHARFEEGELAELVSSIRNRQTDPYTAAENVLERLLNKQ